MSSTRAPRVGTIRILQPAGLLDVTSPRVNAHMGHRVRVTQPYGCPRNGTMGMTYVNCATCSDNNTTGRVVFVGLVNLASLVKNVK